MAQFSGDYVYLIKEREFMRLNENVIKVGYSTSLTDRCRGYPKGSLVLSVHRVVDGRVAEAKILSTFNERFRKRTDIGTEYFEGRLLDIVTAFNVLALPFMCDVSKGTGVVPKISVSKQKQKQKQVQRPSNSDVDSFLSKFLKRNKSARLHCGTIHKAYQRWAPCNRMTRRQFCCAVNKIIRSERVGEYYVGWQVKM